MTTARDAIIDSAPARKVRRGPLTRQQILDASLKLFSERGFARTSVRDIAQAAGITDAAIYYHFASKRDLFEALIEERGFTQVLENLERAEITVGPAEAITALGTQALAFIYSNRDVMKVLMLEAMAEDPVAAEEYRMLVERWERAQARILRHYAEQDSIRIEDPNQLANQIAVTVIGAFADFLMAPSESPMPETPPPALMQHVRTAMQHIAKGLT